MALVARALGAQKQAIFALMYSSQQILTVFLEMGLSSAIIYFGARGELRSKSLLHLKIRWLACTFLFFSPMFFLIMSWTKWVSPYQAVCVIVASLVVTVLNVCLAERAACHDFSFINKLTLIQGVGGFVFILGLVFFNKISPEAVILAMLLSSLFCISINRMKKVNLPENKGHEVVARQILSFGCKIMLADAAALMNYRLSYFFMSGLGGGLGVFSLANGILEKLWIPIQALASVLAPRVASGNESAKISPRRLLYIFIYVLTSALLVGWVLERYGDWLFGGGYSDIGKVVYLLCVGVAAWGCVKLMAVYMASLGRPQENFKTIICCLVVVAVCFSWLRGRLSVESAALITTFSYVVGFFFIIYRAKKMRLYGG